MDHGTNSKKALVARLFVITGLLITFIKPDMSTHSTSNLPANFINLINALPDLVWIAEPDGKVIYLNERVNELQGATRMPDGSWNWVTVLHPDDRIRTIDAWQHAVQEGFFYEIEHRMLLCTGYYRWTLTRAFPQKDEKGNVVKWFGTATNIQTQREALDNVKKSEAEFRAIFEISTAGIVEVDAQGNLLMANRSFAEFLGYAQEELCGMSLNKLTHPDDLEFHLTAFKNLVKDGTKMVHEKRCVRKDGSIVWALVNATALLDAQGNFRHTIAVVLDVTDRRIIEDSIHTIATQLKLATDSAHVGIWSYNFMTDEVEWSALHFELWGYGKDKEKIDYNEWLDSIHPDDKAIVEHKMKHAQITGEIYDCKYRVIRVSDGALKWIHP